MLKEFLNHKKILKTEEDFSSLFVIISYPVKLLKIFTNVILLMFKVAIKGNMKTNLQIGAKLTLMIF